jgi:hypothetical protein
MYLARDQRGAIVEPDLMPNGSPVFSQPILVQSGEIVERDGFVFVDVISQPEEFIVPA